MIDRALNEITFTDIEDLVRFGRSEGRTLDFKAELPEALPRGTSRFLADVTAFANTDGGDLVFGVIEDGEAAAAEIRGVAREGLDERLRGLEDQLRSCVDPRIPDFRIHVVEGPGDRVVIVMRVGSSLIAPHRVAYERSSRFYRRVNRANAEMNTDEIRMSFAASADLPRQIRDLHRRAVAQVDGTDMPVRQRNGPVAIVTVAPLSVLREWQIAVSRDNALLPPRSTGSIEIVVGLDGVIAHTPIDEADRSVRAWAVNHRQGYVDFAWSLGDERTGRKLIWPRNFEDAFVGTIRSAVARLQGHGLAGPWIAMASLVGIRDYSLTFENHFLSEPAWQDPAYLGDVVDDSLNPLVLTSMIDGFYRLFGIDEDQRR